MDGRRRPGELRSALGRVRRARPRRWTRTIPGRTRRPSGSTACRSPTGCATAARRRTWCGRATSRCWRCPPSRSSARRSWPSSARRRPPAATASTTTRSGSAAAWRRARRRWRCGWRRSSGTGSATARPSRASACRPRAAPSRPRPASASSPDAVVCALPVGPLRNVRVEGVSDERMLSLDRQRHALAAKVVFTYADSFWHDNGQNGDAYFETAVIGGTWVQREGIMSTLVPPERLAAFLTTSQAQLEAELTEEMVEAFGERGARHAGGLLPPLGSRPVDARLHHRLAPGRRDVGGPAARHARAALLRVRLGPVGLRLHGGRRPDRSRRCRCGRSRTYVR